MGTTAFASTIRGTISIVLVRNGIAFGRLSIQILTTSEADACRHSVRPATWPVEAGRGSETLSPASQSLIDSHTWYPGERPEGLAAPPRLHSDTLGTCRGVPWIFRCINVHRRRRDLSTNCEVPGRPYPDFRSHLARMPFQRPSGIVHLIGCVFHKYSR